MKTTDNEKAGAVEPMVGLRWSGAIPKREGWYWQRVYNMKPWIVLIIRHPLRPDEFCIASEGYPSVMKNGPEWAGPISEPI